jgi:hypothetical protein
MLPSCGSGVLAVGRRLPGVSPSGCAAAAAAAARSACKACTAGKGTNEQLSDNGQAPPDALRTSDSDFAQQNLTLANTLCFPGG